MSERFSNLWSDIKLRWYIAAAVVVVLALVWSARLFSLRARANQREALARKSLDRTADAIEANETARIHQLDEAKRQAERAAAARKRVSEIADKLDKGGIGDVADLVRRWNRA